MEMLIDISNHRKKYTLTFNNTYLDSLKQVEEIIKELGLKLIHKDIFKKDNRLKVALEVSGNKKNVKQFTEKLLAKLEIVEI